MLGRASDSGLRRQNSGSLRVLLRGKARGRELAESIKRMEMARHGCARPLHLEKLSSPQPAGAALGARICAHAPSLGGEAKRAGGTERTAVGPLPLPEGLGGEVARYNARKRPKLQ